MAAPKTAAEINTGQHRYTMALYYAYGRTDERYDHVEEDNPVDAMRFAEFYMARWDEFTTGQCSFMPSVQDAFRSYLGTNRAVGGHRHE